MQDPFRPEIAADPSHPPLSAETRGAPLSRERFGDLYRLVEWESFPYFARLNGRGEVEICLVFESAEAFVEAARDEATIEFHTHRDRLIVVVWTITDARQPLGFPLRFDVREERERYLALRLAEQPSIPVHYLALEAGLLVHVYTEEVVLASAERERVAGAIRRLYESGAEASDTADTPDGEDVPVGSAALVSLADRDLTESGTAYLLDYRRMETRLGSEQSEIVLMEAVLEAIRDIRRHSPAGMPSAFTVWAAQRDGTVWLCVTPALPAAAEADIVLDPFARSLLALPEFVEIRQARPLDIGAYPIIRWDNGRVSQVELDESARVRLRSLHEQNGLGGPNPYEG